MTATWQSLGCGLAGVLGLLCLALGWQRARTARQLWQLRLSVGQLGERCEALRGQLEEAQGRREQLQASLEQAQRQLVEAQTAQRLDQAHADEKVQFLSDAHARLKESFEVLSRRLLAERQESLVQDNTQSISQLLSPLQRDVTEFRQRLDTLAQVDQTERGYFRALMQQMMAATQSLGDDARHLAHALRGDNKAQGDWGEMVLERLLEGCGLRRDQDFFVQTSWQAEDGARRRPDVIVHLPDQRRVIIDAKVSLADYYLWQQAEAEEVAEQHAARHLESLRQHIRGLSDKNYQALLGEGTLDCVILFIPIEPAWLRAMAQDPQLWERAWQKNILLAGPSTLLCMLRIVAHMWRQAQQTDNARAIAERGARLYDKFVGLSESFARLGDRLRQAQEAFDEAQGRLSQGRGSLTWQAEQLRALGIQPKATLSPGARAAAELDG